MVEFKIGDKVSYEDKTGSRIGVIDHILAGNLYSVGTKFLWASELILIERIEEDYEQRELKRLEHILEDPFGEEIW